MRKIFLLSAVIIISGAFRYAASADDVIAPVQTQPVARHELAETFSCYGAVSVDPLSTESVNFPRAGQVTRLLVVQGEVVKKGAPILELDTSPEEGAGYEQAQSAVDFARSELARVQSLLEQQLATRSQLAQAQKAVNDAEAALAAQRKRGTGLKRELLSAPFDGIVSAVQVAQGERIRAGATALQLARRDRLRVVLGIEPEDALKVKPGMPVQLTPVFGGMRGAEGVVHTIHGMINPQTGLVDLAVSLKPEQAVRLMPGIRVHGLITLNRRRGFAVPRQAVLADKRGSYIFVVRNGLARRIDVRTGVEDHGLVGITGPFKEQERVVVLGNYELRDGMAVQESAP